MMLEASVNEVCTSASFCISESTEWHHEHTLGPKKEEGIGQGGDTLLSSYLVQALGPCGAASSEPTETGSPAEMVNPTARASRRAVPHTALWLELISTNGTRAWAQHLGSLWCSCGSPRTWALHSLLCPSVAQAGLHGTLVIVVCVWLEAAAGSPLFPHSMSVFITPERNENGFTFVPARMWQLFNFN